MKELAEKHKCESCDDLFTPSYPQDNIFFCKKCATQNLFKHGKKVTPEMITRLKKLYKDIALEQKEKREIEND